MNGGWIPTSAKGWPVTLERLQRLGEPLTEEEAITDLRWHVDQGEPLPGRRELRKRWCNMSERKIREILADTDRWWDPTKGPPPESRADLEARVPVAKRMVIPDASRSDPGRVPVRSRTHTVKPSKSSGNDPGLIPDASRSDPGRVHTRVPQHTLHPSPPPPPKSNARTREAEGASPPEEGAPAKPDRSRARESDPVELVELLALQERDEPQLPVEPRDRDAVKRELLHGTEAAALRALWAWSGESSDAQAEACRRGGWRRWSSLLRGRLGEERLALAAAWDRAGRPRAGGPRAGPAPPRRGASTAGDGVLMGLLAGRLRQGGDRGDDRGRDRVLADPGDGGPGEAVADSGGGRAGR